MRDLLVGFIVFGSLPFVLRRPFWGIVMLAGLGYMNPHRLCYGFMLEMPVVQIVAIVTLLGMLISQEEKRIVWSREIWILLLFVAWMGVTTTQAVYRDLAVQQLEKVVKIQILTFMTLLMLTSRERVHILVWTIVVSLGFYGIKGGIFTIIHGGVHRVQGPQGSFIGGNNEMALALVMTIPLMRYLQLHEASWWIRRGLAAAMLLTAIAAVGSQSRGALIALVITGSYFWWKSRNKIGATVLLGIVILGVLAIMPPEWYERMNSIRDYEQDGSAQGRINAWWTAWNVANDRLLGGGFEMWHSYVFSLYAPEPNNVHDAHSIYFKVLGEHGWIGFAIFMFIWAYTWSRCRRIIRLADDSEDGRAQALLARMIQVSLIGFAVGGAFVNIGNWDMDYYLMISALATGRIVERQAAARKATAARERTAARPTAFGRPASRPG